MDELLTLAVQGISTDAERPEILAMIRSLSERFGAIEVRLTALEGGNDEGNTDNTEQTVYPAWKPWDGISKDYPYGAIVSHNGELWESVFNGQNVWEPGIAGTEKKWEKHFI